VRIAFYQALQVSQGVCLIAGRPQGGFDHLTGSHIQIDIPREGPVPNVLKFPSQDVSSEHSQIRMFPFQGPHFRQLIHADRAFSLPGPFRSLEIDLTSLDDLLFPLRVFLLGQPVLSAPTQLRVGFNAF
jgi:hypothetical protein